MSYRLQVSFSHRVECLYEKMRANVFRHEAHPFARRLIIVPSPAMKSWLHLTMAADPACGIAAGLEIGYIDQTMKKVMNLLNPDLGREFTRLELALLIEQQLTLAYLENSPLWEPVKKFIGVLGSKKSFRRKTGLALQLAGLFERYGLYGGEAVAEWETEPADWQQELWCRVWLSANGKVYPKMTVNQAIDASPLPLLKCRVEIHLLSMSFLPKPYHRLLVHLSQYINVNYYILSPCLAFWSDIQSDRESRRLYLFWKKKGASLQQLSALEEFLQDRNPLLANFGRLGREMAEMVEVANCQADELYALPASLMDDVHYQELLSDEVVALVEPHPVALLDYVHADLLLLRNPAKSDKISLEADASIQLHRCPSKRREIEVLYSVLIGLLDRHKNDALPLTPADIIVMAPDLMEYESFIKSVFTSEDLQLDFQLMEVELLSQSSFVQAFLALLGLSSSRWDAASLVAIFELPFVQRKHGFTIDDIKKFRQWIKEAGIRWGDDADHCQEILQREMCVNQLNDEEQPGTWEFGIHRLLHGLALTSAAGAQFTEWAPLELVETSSSELLGRWIEFLKNLKEDLRPLQDGTLLPMEHWIVYLKTLIDAYFSVDMADKEELENRRQLFTELDKLQKADAAKDTSYTYLTIKVYIDHLLQAKKVNYRESHLHAVRFCSLLPMRALPAKVVVLLGMEDSAFPRAEMSSQLDLLRGNSKADFIPSQGDFDRSLFLEALLSARRYFILSYSAYAEGQEEAPSILSSELFAYLDMSFDFQGYKPSEVCQHAHPLHGFDSLCFSENTSFPSYSQRSFKAARAYYQLEKEPLHHFIPNFKPEGQLVAKGVSLQPLAVDVRDLSRMSKNPLQAYFNKTLNMYVKSEATRYVEIDEKFDLTALDMYLLKEKTLFGSIADVLQQAKKEGELPSGVFKELVIQNLETQAKNVDENLLEMNVDKGEIFNITLANYFESPQCIDSNWYCPPLRCELESGLCFILTGTIKNVTPQGLLAFKEHKLADIIPLWPSFLLLNAIIKRDALPICPALLLIKEGKSQRFAGVDLEASLHHFLDYYINALRHVSPLDPQWVKNVLQSNADGLDKTIKSNLGRSEQHFYNDYAKWSFGQEDLYPQADAIVQHWKERALLVFGPLADVLDGKNNAK